MSDYPNPCEKCPKDGTSDCYYNKCQPWLKRYRHRQKQINAYAIRQGLYVKGMAELPNITEQTNNALLMLGRNGGGNDGK